jgi:hypothetical protein
MSQDFVAKKIRVGIGAKGQASAGAEQFHTQGDHKCGDEKDQCFAHAEKEQPEEQGDACPARRLPLQQVSDLLWLFPSFACHKICQ